MAKEQCMHLLREILEETDWNYGDIYEDGDEYNDEVFIFSGYGEYTVESLNELCKAKLKENDVDTYPDYTYDSYYIDFITGDNWGYYDSYFECSECGKAYRMNEYGAANYWCEDGFICEDCVKEKYKEDYVEYLANNPQHVNTILSVGDLEELGFEKANEDRYENGWYGTTDCPTEIYEDMANIYPTSDILFHLRDINPFAVYFDCYIRISDEDKSREKMYIDKTTGEVMTYKEMEQYCKENYDYGDETNFVTYMEEWWKEYDFKEVGLCG